MQNLSKLYNERLIQTMHAFLILGIAALFAVLFSVNLGIAAETAPLKSFTDFLRHIPEDAWNIIKIAIGFWFGGCVLSYLANRQEDKDQF